MSDLLARSAAKRVAVALSGGVDSTALLAALLASDRLTVPLRALHVNHRLHPEAADWERHCRRLCRRLGVPLAVRRANIVRGRGESLEALARDARYGLLASALHPGELLLTAQHLDDQLETVLLQMLRGAGVAGLAAMPTLAPLGAGWLGRPLLAETRTSIVAWAQAQALEWVDDGSNADERFDRNFLRRRVLPLVRERWPAAARTVARSAVHAGEALEVLGEVAVRDLAALQRGVALDFIALGALPAARQRLALRAWLAARGVAPPDSATLERIRQLPGVIRGDARLLLRWPGGELRRHAGLVYAEPPQAQVAPAALEGWSWRSRRRLRLGPGLGTLVLRRDPHGQVDLERLPPQLQVQFRAGGERVSAWPGGPRRRLKDLLREAQVLPWARGRVPLLFDGAALVAVPGICVAAGYAARPGSRARATLEWHDAPVWRAPSRDAVARDP